MSTMANDPGDMPKPSNCPYTADDVFYYSEDLAESVENPAMEMHLKECRKCSEVLDGFVRVSDAVKKLAPAAPAAKLSPAPVNKGLPDHIGDFKILSEIAEGGMGKVYKAFDPSLDRLIALKVMKDELSDNAKFSERFISEAKTLARLNHPNIVLVHTVGRHEGQIFIAMELVDGESLLEKIQKRRLGLSDAIETFGQILEGIKAAHEQQIVHRDIKPANIVITHAGLIKVLDFGLAKEAMLGATSAAMETGVMLGTLAYMAPEVAMGMKATKQSDLYALGVVFYQMLTQRIPFFDSATPFEFIERIKTEPLRPPSELNPEIPKHIEALILKLCAKRPEDRYPTVDAALSALAGAAAGRPKTKRPSERTIQIHESKAPPPRDPVKQASPSPERPAPWQEHAGDKNATSFYFCEACGKRVTDVELETGAGRHKKRKGVYCADCGIGVMTVEFDAALINAARAPAAAPVMPSPGPGAKKPGSGRSAAVTGERSIDRTAHASKAPRVQRREGASTVTIIACVVGAGILAAIFFASQKSHTPVVASVAPISPKASLLENAKGVDPAPTQRPVVLPAVPKEVPASISLPVKPSLDPNPVAAVPLKPDPEIKPAPELPAPVVAKIVPPIEPAPVAEVKKVTQESETQLSVVSAAGQKLFDAVLKELAPLLKRNRFGDADKLLDDKLHDPALTDAFGLLKKEKADLAEIRALRQRAVDALKAKKSTVVTLKIRGIPMTGTVKDEPNRLDVALALRDGPEMTLKADQLDVEDVDAYAPAESGGARGQDLWRRGLLFIAAGDNVKAEDYFTKSRDAGSADAASYLERLAGFKTSAREALAAAAWKKAEALFAGKNWKAARQAYDAFQRDYSGSEMLAANAESLKKRLNAIDEALSPAKELTLDLGGGIRLELVLIAPGEFTMGAEEGEAVEKPAHKVRITKSFYMGKYPVTQAQYEKVMGRNPSEFKGENLPVEMEKFTDAEEFCKKAGALAGKTVRLPYEAEWEFACRAGTTTRYFTGDHGPDADLVGWHKGNSENKTHPVGQKKANAWGLYDMHGNVWEWCQDWFDGDYYAKSAVEDPAGSMQGTLRAVRGGAWRCDAWDCRSAARIGLSPDASLSYIGFRVIVPVVRAP